MNTLFQLVVFIIISTITFWSHFELAKKPLVLLEAARKERETLYLPTGKGLKHFGFGYTNMLANLIWFNTINYFGKHHKTDQKYDWFFHMCKLTTSLDPHAPKVTEFCGNMLAWEVHTPEKSIEILSKTIKQRPEDWVLYYLRGSINMSFLDNIEDANKDYLKASNYPEAPALITRLAAKSLIELEKPQAAVDFLEDKIANSKDLETREALKIRLLEAQNELYIFILENAITKYRSLYSKNPPDLGTLKDAGLVKEIVKDPLGGEYRYDPVTNTVSSEAGIKRIKGTLLKEEDEMVELNGH